jgi:hypothetical protein
MVSLSVLAGMALTQQDKYTVKALNGVAFSEFRGSEDMKHGRMRSESD